MIRFRTSLSALGVFGLAVLSAACAVESSSDTHVPELTENASIDAIKLGTDAVGGAAATTVSDPTRATTKGSLGGVVVGPIVTPVNDADSPLRADAPQLAMIASGSGWRTYQVTGNLLDPDTQALIASDEPVVVIDSVAGVATSPLSKSVQQSIAAQIAALPAEEQGGSIIVRKSIDDRLQVAATQATQATQGTQPVAVPLLGCANEDHTYSREFSRSTAFHYSKGDEAGSFSGNVKLDGTASGDVTAAVTLRVNRVWTPWSGCETYWGHLKRATLSGRGDVVADTTANGHFAKEWHTSTTVLAPTLYNDWITVGGLPVKIKVTLPIEAGIDASARLDVTSSGHVEAHGTFNVVCTTSGCDGSKSATYNFGPTGAPSIGVNARAQINPWAQAGVKVELYDGVADGKIGVRATLNSDFWGYYGNTCGDADHNTIPEFVQAATLDLGAKVDLRAEVGFFGSTSPYSWNLLNYHIGFYDLLGHSTALDPIYYVQSKSGSNGATVTGRMRPCYPYTDNVHYSINWGDGTAAEPFDFAANGAFSRYHTFQPNGINGAVMPGDYSTHLTAGSDVVGRQLQGTAATEVNFRPVLVYN